MSEHASRNAPCPCGSGKKRKRCCAECFVAGGGGAARCATCGEAASAGLSCSYCSVGTTHCRAHHGKALQLMREHALRAHPEKVPGMVERLRKSPERLSVLRSELQRDPESWRHLAEIVWPPG